MEDALLGTGKPRGLHLAQGLELLHQLGFLRAKLRGGEHLNPESQIASAITAKFRHTPALHRDDITTLNTRLDHHGDITVQSWQSDFSPQHCVCEIEFDGRDDVVPRAGVKAISADRELKVEVTGLAATVTNLALARKVDALAGFDATGDIHRE
jgi:hypothetical protein